MSENQNTNINDQFQEEDNQKLINENQQTQNNFSPNNESHYINEEQAPMIRLIYNMINNPVCYPPATNH